MLCASEAYRQSTARRRRTGIVGEREMQAAEYWLSAVRDIAVEPPEVFAAAMTAGHRGPIGPAAMPKNEIRPDEMEGLILLARSESLGAAIHTEPTDHFRCEARRVRARAASRDIRRDRDSAATRQRVAAYGEALAIQAMGDAWFIDRRHPSEW
jgi:hypothetical protein